METKFVKIENPMASQEDIHIAANILKNGGLVVFPTETVYGLGGDATNAKSSQKIYAAKGRPSDNPLIIHIASPEEAEKYAVTNQLYYTLAKAFMPGPLTCILPKKETIPFSTTGGLETVAIRCPSHPIAHALIETCGFPIAAPSANLSGKPSPTCAEHVAQDMNGRVDMIIDGGSSEIGLESTIVLVKEDNLVLLRPGGITYDALCMVADNVSIAPAVTEAIKENEKPLSPGMKYKHYAPDTPVVLLKGNDEKVISFLQKKQKETSCAILCYDEELPYLQNTNLFPVGKKQDLSAQAHTLFTYLREADKCHTTIIYAHLPPMQGLGLALYNRMIRAAAHTILDVD